MDNNPGFTNPPPQSSHDNGPGGTIVPGEPEKIKRERQDWHKEQEKVAKERWKMEAQVRPCEYIFHYIPWHEMRLDTLRRTIHHLTEENNQLHVDLIHAADGLDAERIRARLATRSLEEEIEGLRFVNTQHLRALAIKDGDVEREHKRVEEFLKAVEGGKGRFLCLGILSVGGQSEIAKIVEIQLQ
ncbi:hypothetical protein BC937DRAFT_89251 [Endogone sp. FLAS-F59071]|nr:hypothetical protein BC937DRAFT_89251 [Endogone sp. FLAS-F59071]|eukprot:RUS18009.1 hypothetical protein BC937DRAFT_89251 [Endogone sp. FLAS-F59071]